MGSEVNTASPKLLFFKLVLIFAESARTDSWSQLTAVLRGVAAASDTTPPTSIIKPTFPSDSMAPPATHFCRPNIGPRLFMTVWRCPRSLSTTNPTRLAPSSTTTTVRSVRCLTCREFEKITYSNQGQQIPA